jgi:hypothetical protein
MNKILYNLFCVRFFSEKKNIYAIGTVLTTAGLTLATTTTSETIRIIGIILSALAHFLVLETRIKIENGNNKKEFKSK